MLDGLGWQGLPQHQQALGNHPCHRIGVNGAFAPLVDTSRLGAFVTLALAFLADVGLELDDGIQDAQDQLPHAGGSIDRSLFHAPKAHLLGRQLGDDVVQIATRSSEAVKAGHHQFAHRRLQLFFTHFGKPYGNRCRYPWRNYLTCNGTGSLYEIGGRARGASTEGGHQYEIVLSGGGAVCARRACARAGNRCTDATGARSTSGLTDYSTAYH